MAKDSGGQIVKETEYKLLPKMSNEVLWQMVLKLRIMGEPSVQRIAAFLLSDFACDAEEPVPNIDSSEVRNLWVMQNALVKHRQEREANG